ncbi:MAG: glutamate formimidoyltransferase [Acidobacteriota bacterium]
MLECVPNISEGRRPEVIQRLVKAVRRPGVQLLDHSSDPDHHRSVLTLAGAPGALHGALLDLYEVAIETIDLGRHDGRHPRLGAVDVVPFVPLGEATMATAIATATDLAEAVAQRFDLPVFLYEEAARHSRRSALPEIRRGGFEGLPERLATTDGAPDFGPPRRHPTAGATVIGARQFLVAFNLVLESDDLALARRIARRLRERDGGLPGVRALGIAVPTQGRVQVSVNLIAPERTSLATVVAEVRRLAAAEGVDLADSELIGLLPQRVLYDAARQALGLPALDEAQVVEAAIARRRS